MKGNNFIKLASIFLFSVVVLSLFVSFTSALTAAPIAKINSSVNPANANTSIIASGIDLSGSGIASVKIYEDNVLIKQCTTSMCVYNASYNSPVNKSYYAVVSDKVGGTTPSNTMVVRFLGLPPVLNPIGNKVVFENTNVTFNISAFDYNNLTLNFSADGGLRTDLEMNLTDNHDGTATFSWSPTHNQTSFSYLMTFVVTNAVGLTDSEAITITTNYVRYIALIPTSMNLNISDTQQLNATALNGSHDPIVPAPTITYTSSNNSVATVSSSGLVTAIAAGTAIINASSGSASNTTVVTVNPSIVSVPVLNSITLSPSNATLNISNTLQLNAMGYDQFNMSMSNITINYTSSNSSIATVDINGLVTAIAAGSATITATSGNVTNSSMITVNPVIASPSLARLDLSPSNATLNISNTLQLNVTGYDQFNAIMNNLTINYTSSNSSIVNVSSTGLVTAISAGNVTITASVGNITNMSLIEVFSTNAAPVLTTISLLPVSGSLNIGSTLQLNATGYDQFNNVINATINYTSSDSSIATVDSNGLVTGVAAGNVTITATSGNVTNSSIITVNTNSNPNPTSGGGGGGSSNNGKIITINDDELRNGIYVYMNLNDRLDFSFCGAPYHIKLTDANDADNEASFKFTPGSGSVILKEGNNAEFDIDSNGVNDITFRVESVSGNRVKVYIKRISDTCNAIKLNSNSAITGNAINLGSGESHNSIWIIISLISGILLALFAILLLASRKIRRKRFTPVVLKQ